jgi:hypothetical protein
MFESFDVIDKYLIYRALLDSVRANSGYGFRNKDQRHPAYTTGASNEKPMDYGTIGDHPDRNQLYKMMRELSESFKDDPELKRSDLVLSWQDFCTMAVNAYDAARKKP